MSRIWIAVVIVLGIGPNVLSAEEIAPAKDGEGGHKRLVVRLASVPAAKTADALQELFRAEGQAVPSAAARSVVIVPEIRSNSLILAGPPDAVEEVRQLAMQLDHTALLVHLEVLIALAPTAEIRSSEPAEKPKGDSVAGQARLLEKPEKMVIISRAWLTTLSGQVAYLHIGRKEGEVGETKTFPGVQLHSIGHRDERTVIKIVPRVGPDGRVTLRVDVEDSRLGPAEKPAAPTAPKEGESPQTRKVETFKIATELSVADRQTVVLGGAARTPNSGIERLLLVTPWIQPVGGRKVSVR